MGWDLNDFPEHIQKQFRDKERSDNNGTPTGKVSKSVPHDHSMNKTERRYAGHLESLKMEGTIKDYLHEPFNIRLGKNTFYKPDFLVVTADNEIEVHEVKGYWRDDAKVKIKVAAERVPWFRYKAIYYNSSGWNEEAFEPFRGTKMLSENGE